MISLITTIKNEAKTISNFLDSIINQSVYPDEFIIVDSESNDGTIEILNSYEKKFSFRFKVIIKKCNIAEGRNLAISEAKGDIILVTDAGCELDVDWIKEMTIPFNKTPFPVVVYGSYYPINKNLFDRVFSKFYFPTIEDMKDKKFLPSSRCLAFKKKAWLEVGGYPEHLFLSGEDTLFDIRLKNAGFEFYFASNAVVKWEAMKNFNKLYNQIFTYSRGEGEIFRMFTLNQIKLFIIIISFTISLSCAILLKSKILLYISALVLIFYFLTILKIAIKRKFFIKEFLYLVPIRIVIDIARIKGWFVGWKLRYKRTLNFRSLLKDDN